MSPAIPDRINTAALASRLRWAWSDRVNRQRLARLSRQVTRLAPEDPAGPPVVYFRASTGILHLSLNAAFGLLSAWGLRVGGIPVVHYACQAGMSLCVQGLDRQDYYHPPPCQACIAQTRRTYAGAPIEWFGPGLETAAEAALEGLPLEALARHERAGLPLGELVMPSVRWALRRHHLPDDKPTRFLVRRFLLSAARLAGEFSTMLERTQPLAVVVFNGTFFPEAVARFVARQHSVPTVSYEVGFQPFSAFFTPGEATAYPIDIPAAFELNPEQEARLDAYLQERFRGDFTMAGIRFWPEMRGLDPAFLEKAGRFRQIVPVFTNVVFDTSQVHANTIFAHMFAWLDVVAELIDAHPETLFVLRAHPDESRKGKESRESVEDWVARSGLARRENVVFVGPDEYLSSYKLIQSSKFVLVYNSSIGLEAALLGAAVVCAGRARYTQIPTAYLPESVPDYRQFCEQLLETDTVSVPEEFRRNARRFLYYQLYRTSLPFNRFLEAAPQPGFVRLRQFDPHLLRQERSPTMKILLEGITQGKAFLMDA